MKRAITIATTSVAAVLLTLTMSVSAQDFNTQKRTIMTFSAPVEMPGVTLPAGTYVFKLSDIPSRNVVQVFDKDEKDIIGQWLFVSAERPQVTGETVVTFKETREGTTPAVQFWYYPGEKIGKEFIYPKEQALKIAARTGAEVRSDDGVVKGSGLPAEEPKAEARVAVAEPAAAPVEAPAPVGTSGYSNAPVQESTTASAELPRTASRLPLAGLLGLFSIVGAAGLRRYRRQ